MTMTMVATMPGRWPPPDEGGRDQEEHFPPLRTQLFLQIPAATSSTPSRDSGEELLLDITSPHHSSGVEQNSTAGMPSYLIFDPVVESVSENEPIDWRRYDPPGELFNAQEETSDDLRAILGASIERIKTRHIEDEEERAAAARRERPLARVGRASVKPKREVCEAISTKTFNSN